MLKMTNKNKTNQKCKISFKILNKYINERTYLETVEPYSRRVRRKAKQKKIYCVYTHCACAQIKVEDKSWAIHFKSSTESNNGERWGPLWDLRVGTKGNSQFAPLEKFMRQGGGEWGGAGSLGGLGRTREFVRSLVWKLRFHMPQSN